MIERPFEAPRSIPSQTLDEPAARGLNPLEHRYRLLERAPQIPESRHHQPVALPRLDPLEGLAQK